MLLWISAAGLAGAGWFGWLLWQDYDWSGVTFKNAQNRTGSANKHKPVKEREDEPIDLYANDLLGATQTQWGGYQPASTPSYEPTGTVESKIEPVQAETPINDEDFVVVGDSSLSNDANASEEPRITTDEDFVVINSPVSQSGISPFQHAVDDDEDFVVVKSPEATADELPEVDLSDYVESWTPIVPKIAALISHELWPQLRSYLQSLPQFGDTNLEQVVNAVAEDVGVETVMPGGVGEESADGFAFYASLFDEMAERAELAEA